MEKGLYQNQTLESLVDPATKGNKSALEELIRGIQDKIYQLAIRTLFLPVDAEDATQEILIKVITHLAGFKGESRFTTWVFRIAANHLMTTHKRRAEKWDYSFDLCDQGIEAALSKTGLKNSDTPENLLLAEEVRLGCMQGMLLCLSRDIRLAFILGVVFEVTSDEGGHILNIKSETFRQRLSRGRRQIQQFMTRQCSLVKSENRCVCAQLVQHEIRIKLLDPGNLRFANHRCRAQENDFVAAKLQEMDELKRIAALFRSHPDYMAPESYVESIKKLVESGRLQILNYRT
jgi:RNA polymerase sigma factor (sigma-70 family)